MTILLSSDDYVYLFRDHYYVRNFGKVLIDRYLSVFDQVYLVWRTRLVKSEESLGQYTIPMDERVKVIDTPFFQGPIEYTKVYHELKRRINRISINEISLAIFRLPSNIGFVVCNAIIRLGIPYAVEIVANPFELMNTSDSFVTKFSMYLWHRSLKKAVNQAKGVSCVTKISLQRRYPSHDGQILASYSSADIPDNFFGEKRCYPHKGKFVICHVASVVKNDAKGNKEVIDVIDNLKKKDIICKVVFVGEGSYMDECLEYAKTKNLEGSICFKGIVNQQELLLVLNQSDMMLFPSKSEGLPRVIIEAMATGLPCVASNVGGIPELLPPDDVFSPIDVSGMTRRVEQILTDPIVYESESEKMVKNSREFRKDVLEDKRKAFYTALKHRVLD